MSLLTYQEGGTIGDRIGIVIGDGIGVVMDGATISAFGNKIMSDTTNGATISAIGNDIMHWETDGATIKFAQLCSSWCNDRCCALWNKEIRN